MEPDAGRPSFNNQSILVRASKEKPDFNRRTAKAAKGRRECMRKIEEMRRFQIWARLALVLVFLCDLCTLLFKLFIYRFDCAFGLLVAVTGCLSNPSIDLIVRQVHWAPIGRDVTKALNGYVLAARAVSGGLRSSLNLPFCGRDFLS